jgi:hypothetical protein
MNYSWAGKMRKALYKAPLVFIRVRTADQQVRQYRFVPGMAETGFVVNPLLLNNNDVLNLYEGMDGQRVVSFCITTDEKARSYFEKDIEVTIHRAAAPAEWAQLKPELNGIRFPMLKTPPAEVHSTGGVGHATCDGQDVLMVHAEGKMCYKVSSGRHRISGQFGILPGAYEEGKTDGVLFTVEYQSGEGVSQVLFERYLDPLAVPGDRGIQTLELDCPFPDEGSIILRTSNRPGKNESWDWSYWTGVAIEERPRH